MRTRPLKIYGGTFDGTWDLRVASTSWPAAVALMGNMGVSYAKRYGQAWSPRPEDEFLLDPPSTVYRCKATQYPKEWEKVPVRLRPEPPRPQPSKPMEPKMDQTTRMIANLVGDVVSKIRTRFGVVPGMTPTRVIDMSDCVGNLLLDHLSQICDVREITDEKGHLRIPRYETETP